MCIYIYREREREREREDPAVALWTMRCCAMHSSLQ